MIMSEGNRQRPWLFLNHIKVKLQSVSLNLDKINEMFSFLKLHRQSPIRLRKKRIWFDFFKGVQMNTMLLAEIKVQTD